MKREQLVAHIHTALEACHGKVTVAAKRLGLNPSRMLDVIEATPTLKARWGGQIRGQDDTKLGPPGEESTIHRKPATITFGKEVLDQRSAAAIAQAAEDEEAALRAGLLNVGIRGASLEISLHLRKLQKQHYGNLIAMMSAGLVVTSIGILEEINRITEELKKTDIELERERILREDRRVLMDIYGRFKEKADRSALIQATVRKLDAEAKNGGNGRTPGKPGFSALIKADTLHIHEPRD